MTGPVIDTVVVGAGVAGLAAAARLREAGRSVRVLEARDRLGGRIHTVRDPSLGAPVELGAEFVHGAAPVTRALLEEAGVELRPMDGDAWLARDGRVTDETLWEEISRVLEALPADRRPDVSFRAFLDARREEFPEPTREAALAFVEGFHAADPARASVAALASEGVGGAARSHRVPLGYDSLPAILARRAGGGVVRGRVVRRIGWRRGRVRVEGIVRRTRVPFAPVEARSCILALPLGVLQAPPDTRGAVELDPPVPDWTDALDGLAMGAAVRLDLSFERAPWGDPPLLPRPRGGVGSPGFLHAPARPFNAFWPGLDGDGRRLVAWSGGTRAAGLPTEDAAIRAAVVGDLSEAAGADPGELERVLGDVRWYDWRRDRFALGAYPWVVAGGAGASERLAEPAEGTLVLAGDALSPKHLGTVEGALRSGRSAAERLLDGLA